LTVYKVGATDRRSRKPRERSISSTTARWIASETVNLIIYRGEPDEVRSLEVIDSAWMSVAPSPVP